MQAAPPAPAHIFEQLDTWITALVREHAARQQANPAQHDGWNYCPCALADRMRIIDQAAELFRTLDGLDERLRELGVEPPTTLLASSEQLRTEWMQIAREASRIPPPEEA